MWCGRSEREREAEGAREAAGIWVDVRPYSIEAADVEIHTTTICLGVVPGTQQQPLTTESRPSSLIYLCKVLHPAHTHNPTHTISHLLEPASHLNPWHNRRRARWQHVKIIPNRCGCTTPPLGSAPRWGKWCRQGATTLPGEER